MALYLMGMYTTLELGTVVRVVLRLGFRFRQWLELYHPDPGMHSSTVPDCR